MKKVFKILAVMAIVGLLFFVGIGVNDERKYEESYSGLVYSVQDVNADDPCVPPPPPYPNNCH